MKSNWTSSLAILTAWWLASPVASPAADLTAHWNCTNTLLLAEILIPIPGCDTNADPVGCYDSTQVPDYTNSWGSWSVATNWDLGEVPNNSGGGVYDVVLDYGNDTCGLVLDTNVTIRNLTYATDRPLVEGWATPQLSLVIEGNLDWSKGSLIGGAVAVQGTATLRATAPDFLGLSWPAKLALGGATTLDCGMDGGEKSGGTLYNAPGATLTILKGARFSSGPGEIVLQNYGTCRVVPSTQEFPSCAIANYGLFEVNNRNLRLSSILSQYAGTLQLNGGSILSQAVHVYGGRLQGQGDVEYASIRNDGAVAGQFSFGSLSLQGLPKMVVTLGGRAAGDFDQFTIREELVLGGWAPCALEVRFTNGFEHSIGSGEALKIFKLASGAKVIGQFANVQPGQRIETADGHGSFLWANSGGSLALTDFASSAPRLEFASGSTMYPFPSHACHLAPTAVLSAGPSAIWAGGELAVRVGAGFDPAQDRLRVASEGDLPGQIKVNWADTDHGAVFFGGVEFATARRPTSAEMVFGFEASATTAAIQALLRNTLFTNEIFGMELFEVNIDAALPARTIELTLRDGLGSTMSAAREVQFPRVNDIVMYPRRIYVTPGIGAQITVVAYFTGGGNTQWLGGQLHYRLSGGAHLSLSPDPAIPEFMDLRLQDPTPTEFAANVQACAGSFSAERCVRVIWDAVTCLFALFEMTGCPTALAPCNGVSPAWLDAGEETSPTISLAGFHALESLMKQTAEGRRWVDLYWQHSGEVVGILLRHQEMISQFEDLLNAYQPGVAALLSGQGSRALITSNMVAQLDTLWCGLTNYASANLLLALETERARFHGFQDFVGQDFSRWAQMLQIPVPTNAWMRISSAGFTNGQLRLEANAVNDRKVSLWRASDLALKDWARVPDTLMETNGYTLRITDTNLAPPRRFYQLRAQP